MKISLNEGDIQIFLTTCKLLILKGMKPDLYSFCPKMPQNIILTRQILPHVLSSICLKRETMDAYGESKIIQVKLHPPDRPSIPLSRCYMCVVMRYCKESCISIVESASW